MVTVFDMQQKWKSFNLIHEAAEVIDTNKDFMVNLNRAQLLAGLNNRGEYLSPRYSEDPWFKSRQAAENYARWKKKLFPDGNRPEDVPNLTIVGAFHSTIDMSVLGDDVTFRASISFAEAINRKYQGSELGLNPDSKIDATREVIKPKVLERLGQKVGVKIS